MTKIQYTMIFLSLVISAISSLLSAGTFYKMFIHRRNEVLSHEYLDIMLGRAQFLMKVGISGLFTAFVIAVISWIVA